MINLLLVSAPGPLLEYVVVHELCHLKHRNHSKEFWAFVGEALPGFQSQKKWLRDNRMFMQLQQF